jgi:response regulator RpfG family c-di-GMP phosphodiesterase
MSRDPKKPRVLCLDDEPLVLESLRDTLRRKFEIVVSTNGFEALRLLASDPFAVVLTDMRMPMLDGARFLTLAREHAPDTVRVMLTGQSALPDAAAAVNDGQIFKLLIKPCKTDDLTAALEAAVVEHTARVAQRSEYDGLVEAAVQGMMKLAAQIDPDGRARGDRIKRHALELAGQVKIASTSELVAACALMQIGAVGVSSETRARAGSNSRLGPEHATELERLPELAAPLVPALAALKPVAALLAATAPALAARRSTPDNPGCAQVLRIALDYELQLSQGAPGATAMRALNARANRYDDALLATWGELMQFT